MKSVRTKESSAPMVSVDRQESSDPMAIVYRQDRSPPMVGVHLGPMVSLLGRLGSLKAVKRVKDEAENLNGDLRFIQQAMKTTMEAIDATIWPEVEPIFLKAQQWMRLVREVAYDMEDFIDSVEHPQAFMSCGGMKEQLLIKLRPADQVVKQITDFKMRIKKARDHYEVCKVNTNDPSPILACPAGKSSPILPCPAEESTDGSQQTRTDDEKAIRDTIIEGQHLSIIVGPGGFGKTTLADNIYREHLAHFKCCAFVYAGQNASVRKILINIFEQTKCPWPEKSEDGRSCHEQMLVYKLSGFLKDKKYFIVIDDVWSSTIWRIIRCALPDNNLKSKIVITTRRRDVATSACYYAGCTLHELKPLSFTESKKLIHVAGSCPEELSTIFNTIVGRCRGVPLAVTLISGILGCREPVKAEWMSVCDSICAVDDEDALRKIVYLSYMDLHLFLKSCFLYLSVYPPGYRIRKGHLIKRWIAEGFINGRNNCGERLQETGETYLHELVNRNLIQAVPVEQDGWEETYTVNGMIHELIVSLSMEENFFTVSGKWIPQNMVRRLSLHGSNHQVVPTILSSKILSHVRSLTVFEQHQLICNPSELRYLRVLDLEDVEMLEFDQIKDIGKLFFLKYLGLGGQLIKKIPEQVGNLKFLETMEIRKTNIRELSVNVLPPNLVHLLMTDGNLQDGMKKLSDIEELLMLRVSGSSKADYIEQLSELNNLIILGIKWSFSDAGIGMEKVQRGRLLRALDRLSEFDNLRSITFDTDDGQSIYFCSLVESWAPNKNLEKFRMASLTCYLQNVPKKMTASSVPCLAYIEIGIAQMTTEEFETIGSLPFLVVLKLRCGSSITENSCIISDDGFQRLEEFWFTSADWKIPRVTFQEKPLPCLQKLRLHCRAGTVYSLDDSCYLDITKISRLNQLYVKVEYGSSEDCEFEATKTGITRALNIHNDPDGKYSEMLLWENRVVMVENAEGLPKKQLRQRTTSNLTASKLMSKRWLP